MTLWRVYAVEVLPPKWRSWPITHERYIGDFFTFDDAAHGASEVRGPAVIREILDPDPLTFARTT